MRARSFCVYILASRSRRLYVGVTNDLVRRLGQHRAGQSAFTARYQIDRLVYYEQTPNAGAAIAREKELKGWTRERKLALVEAVNAGWRDLAADWIGADPE